MKGKIFLFREDKDIRHAALRNAGYEIETFASLIDLARALSSRDNVVAVMISETATWSLPPDVLPTIRCATDAPLVLLQGRVRHDRDLNYDLQVSPAVSAAELLLEFRSLLAHRRTTRRSLEFSVEANRVLGDHTARIYFTNALRLNMAKQ